MPDSWVKGTEYATRIARERTQRTYSEALASVWDGRKFEQGGRVAWKSFEQWFSRFNMTG